MCRHRFNLAGAGHGAARPSDSSCTTSTLRVERPAIDDDTHACLAARGTDARRQASTELVRVSVLDAPSILLECGRLARRVGKPLVLAGCRQTEHPKAQFSRRHGCAEAGFELGPRAVRLEYL